jgi:hypothetical protein
MSFAFQAKRTSEPASALGSDSSGRMVGKQDVIRLFPVNRDLGQHADKYFVQQDSSQL